LLRKISFVCLALAACLPAFQLSPKQQKNKEAQLRKELRTPYDKWINVDVAYIITDEERAAFNHLRTDEERENFIETFWQRRDPTPDTVENEYKEEHYRRFAYANEHFASGVPGWKTDRGHIYIVFGAPDERDVHASGGFYERPAAEGGGSTSTFPFEIWCYRHLDDIGENIEMEFVDPTMSGEFRYTIDPSEKDALLYVPGAGLTWAESQGLASKADRFNRTDGTHLAAPFGAAPESLNAFTRLEQQAKVFSPPRIHMRDLEAVVNSRVTYNVLPIKVRVDFIPVTEASVLTYITVQFENRDLQFRAKDGLARADVNVLGMIHTLTRRAVTSFEDTITVSNPSGMLEAVAQRKSVFNKTIPLPPGAYRLDIAARDLVGNNLGTYQVAIEIPRLEEGRLQASSLVLADRMERASARSIGAGQFALGDSVVRPRVDSTFHRGDRLGVFLNVYHLAGRTPDGVVTYEIARAGSNEKVYESSAELAQLPGASSSQTTLQREIDLKDLAPGTYTVRIRVEDRNGGRQIAPSATFTVL
jgi:GWxTD domain-containing protein